MRRFNKDGLIRNSSYSKNALIDYHNNSEDLDELCTKLGIVINKTNIANLKENLSRAGLPLLYEKKISRSSSYDDYQLIEAYKISTSIKELSNKLGIKFIQKNIKVIFGFELCEYQCQPFLLSLPRSWE